MSSEGKNIHPHVLVKPHSLDWRIFGQNPDICLPCFLERYRTSSALAEPNLCDYVCYVVEKPLCPPKEKIYINPFWQTLILPTVIFSAKTQLCVYLVF